MNSNNNSHERDEPQEKTGSGSRAPVWLYFTPFLGKPPILNERQWLVIGLMSLVVFISTYDLGLFSLALKQIQASLDMPEEELGRLGALVRLGSLPAFFFTLIADRIGRKRIMVFSTLVVTLLTGASAFSTGISSFIVLQFLIHIFGAAAVLLAFVVLAEELDPEVRGWGLGALTALGACGGGLALGLFAFIYVLPFGWRALYLIGLLPILWIASFNKHIPESRRFEAFQEGREKAPFMEDLLRPIISLVRMYPGRFLALGSVIFLLNFSLNASGFFTPKYLQEAHGWAPWHYAALGYFGGFIGIFGSAYAGRLSDRRGRRKVASFFLSVNPFLVLAFFQFSGFLLPPLWIGMVFSGIAGGVVLNAFGQELFPTSYRSTSSGALMILGTAGGVLGLWAESLIYNLIGSHWTAISILAVLSLAAPIIVAFFFPETSKKTLEAISPEI